jgi:hypothetical protein
MRENKPLQDRDKHWIRGTILQEAIDPRLESTMQCELGPQDLVFGENQEHAADRDPQYCHCNVIAVRELSRPFHDCCQCNRQ